ncbi:MFS transporter [Nocardioides sambongensis]|uniref:MFS transporter n=1 Tax=Nocardioides sambongensis TaxID=2589074 RepID=UPI00112E1ECD|nr:MFS transporter [Nocardioides sambongensis]
MTTAPRPDVSRAAEPPPEEFARAWLTVVVLCLGGLTAAVTQTLVIPIQGELPLLLHTSAPNASWVVTASLVGGAVAMPIAGRLADLLGKQRVLIGTLVVLAAGSVVCALSDALLPMLAGRVLQGCAMGFIPVGIALLREVTPPHLTTTAIAAMSATLGVGGAIALPGAAWVVQDFDWHVLFWATAALAVAMVIAVLVVVPHVEDAHGGRVDLVGAVGLAVGLVAFLVGVSKGNDWGWASVGTLATISGGVLLLALWAVFELRVDDPLCDLRVSVRRPVLLTNLSAIAFGFGMMAQAIVVPQLLSLSTATGYGLGQTFLQAGLWMAPAGLTMMAFAPVASRLIRALGARITLMIGGAVIGGGYLVAVGYSAEPWQLMVVSCISSAGVGIGYAAMPTLILESVPITESGSAVGINGLMRSVGTSISAAVMAAILTAATVDLGGFPVPAESQFRICFLVGAVAAFTGVALAALVPRRVSRPQPAAH